MAKIKIDTAYLHNTFLLNGKNFGPTVEAKKVSGLEMIYDDVEKQLWFTYHTSLGTKTGFAPEPNISFLVPEQGPALQVARADDPMDLAHGVATPPPAPKGKIKAQVSSPQGHVFEGPGAGQTGQK